MCFQWKGKVIKNNTFIKQKRVQSSYNPFLKKYLHTVNEKNILIQSMEKEEINSSEIFPIVYSLLSLCIILSISITLHFFNWLSSMLLGQSSILSLSSNSCIMHCIIFHIIFYGFLNKEAPTFKSINNINKCIKDPFPIILK